MSRFLVLALVLIASTLFSVAQANVATASEDELYPMTFPIVGDVYYSDTFGACRGSGCSRRHLGNDLMTYGLKGVPIVAAHDGVVRSLSTEFGRACCAIWGITADDGWETWYIHMNNDTPGTDDGNGWGFAPGIRSGVRVTEGQLIGWVGDSGNAEGTGPHLHFELHKPDGSAISPYASLRAAKRVDLPRIWGANRFDTASDIALESYSGGASTVFVTTGRAFPDALAAGAPSAAFGVPIVLTESGTLPPISKSTIETLQPQRIVVVGGVDAISDAVADELALIAPVERIGGINRYETAAMVAAAMFTDPTLVYLVYGYSYTSAVSAAFAAGANSGPLLLTDSESLNSFTLQYLASLSGVEVIVVGDSAAVSQGVLDELAGVASVTSVSRISAGNATAVSIAVSQATFPDGADIVYLATAGDYADALAGAGLAGLMSAPVLLLTASGLDAVDAEIVRLGASETVIFGGSDAVPYSWILPIWNRIVGNTMPLWNSHG